ncbi:lipoprotein [Fulvimarina pelagi HTCC2506]|uniref:Lipoprotein n=2 Tax=Fulvimarina pelagi TaxID=217511 RepID=Q0FZN7_9HYPH|nr:M23 family metallopeptidase [Fulvimarina pelagi]EAU40554.1 lipoprotein [Fulvimarina pelagi HTCC2506]BAT31577.1 lipoprotein [Fulvimarina pelagi]
MRYRVSVTPHSRRALTIALLLATAYSAGCSADAVRLDDGFYTGAVPQNANTQMAANQAGGYYQNVDNTMTGSISPDQAASTAGSGGFSGASQRMPTQQQYAADGVQRGQMPPPPQSGYPFDQSGASSSSTSSANTQMAATQSQTGIGATRGAPPTTLNEQAQRIGSPSPRPATANSNVSGGAGQTVTVQSGDTLSAIARRSGISAEAIRSANNITGDTVRIGQRLVVPTVRPSVANQPAQVAAVQAAPKPYEKPAENQSTPQATSAPEAPRQEAAQPAEAPEQSRIATAQPTSSVADQAAASEEAAPESSGIGRYRWPVQGRVMQRFGEKVGSKRNDGLNISVPRGTPVKAAENGVVIYAGDGLKEFGNTVLVKHDDGLVTVYGNADSLNVKRGDTVKRGQQIASSGMSGDATVPQLHFEVRKDSAPIDPSGYLQ